MNVYFTASARSNKNQKDNHEFIYSTIKKLGHKHIDDYKINKNSDKFYQSDDDHKQSVYKEALNFIKNSDLVILEVSTHSLTMGYLVKHAIESHTPVIALHTKHHTPGFILGISEDIFQLVEYRKDNLEKKLIAAIKYLKGTEDIRFNMMIPPKLSNFLSQEAKTKNISKAHLIRKLLLKHQEEIE